MKGFLFSVMLASVFASTAKAGDLNQSDLWFDEGIQLCQNSSRTDLTQCFVDEWSLTHNAYMALSYIADPSFMSESSFELINKSLMAKLATRMLRTFEYEAKRANMAVNDYLGSVSFLLATLADMEATRIEDYSVARRYVFMVIWGSRLSIFKSNSKVPAEYEEAVQAAEDFLVDLKADILSY